MQTDRFQLARITGKDTELLENCPVGIVSIHLPDDLIIIRSYPLELVVKVVQPGDELGFRGIDFIDFQLSAEEPREDESGDVLRTIGLFEHLPETDFLLVSQPKGISVAFGCRRQWTACFFLVHI